MLVTCTVTIFGLWSHSGTGEEWADDDNSVTSADAQAFKRACPWIGLGRYFYDVPAIWVDLDQNRQPAKTPLLSAWALPENWLDIFIIWDAEDASADVVLKAVSLSLQGTLHARVKQRNAEVADFKLIDDAILAIETDAARLGSMKTWTETIKANSGKLLDEIRKLSEGLELQVQSLRDGLSGLRTSTE